MNTNWKFDQPPNAAACTSSQIIAKQKPILMVSHDADDHGWSFLTGESVSNDEVKLVSMSSIVNLDPTVVEVADLLPGWTAERNSVGSGWTRSEIMVEEIGEI